MYDAYMIMLIFLDLILYVRMNILCMIYMCVGVYIYIYLNFEYSSFINIIGQMAAMLKVRWMVACAIQALLKQTQQCFTMAIH